MTFSLTALDEKTGQLGIIITTSSICVGARCPWVRSGVGAVATQNVTLPSIGNDVLDKIESGMDAKSALNSVMSGQLDAEYRQVCVIDAKGNTAVFSGEKILGIFAESAGKNCVAGGNLLSNDTIPQVLVDTFQNTTGHLANRLIESLQSAIDAGGEVGDIHSCALLIADKHKWPLVDLRVDWSDTCPLAELKKLWGDYEPQMLDYITRALHPSEAPSYGVPGDR